MNPSFLSSPSFYVLVLTRTSIPSAFAAKATAYPMFPNPINPRVLPRIPLQEANIPLFHFPAFSKALPSAARLSIERMSPIASSATAFAFFPGQLATYTPFREACMKSIVSYPAPALTIS